MANKKIVDLPASGALVGSTLYETELTAGGASQAATHTQLLTFIQNLATAFAQNINIAGNLSIGGGNVTITAADGSASFGSGSFTIGTDGQITVGALGLTIFAPDGSGAIGNVTIGVTGNVSTPSDIEITDTTKGYITKSPNGTRYRIKVDNAGQLGTEAA